MRALAFVGLLALSFPAFAAATIDGGGLLSLLITLVIVGLICYLLWWFIGYIALPAPFDKVARVLVALVALVFLINILMGLGGSPMFRF